MATEPAISQTGSIDRNPQLPAGWWTELRSALEALAGHTTERVCVRQAHLTARIGESYGDIVDTTVTDWACAHGDIGWANLTGPELTVLDWESWGTVI
ncbi:hypothetical protein [Streptomyces sp. NPDC056480]|uniref:hypothetical protein n=1 Tax=Streptomyces sp. NPDC056480 TaxID=3345833 RepID=UPI0036CE8602